jgi:hypothetical protein
MKVAQGPRGSSLDLRLSNCAREYLTALEFPFTQKSVACIPDLHSVPSKKVRCKTRFTFSTGTTGDGFVAFNPWCNNNSQPVGGASTAAYAAGANIGDPVLPSANVAQIFQTKIPYPASAFHVADPSSGVQARTVGFGLRVRYIGPEMARSGQIIAIRQPDNETLVARTFVTCRSYETAKTFNNKRQWVYVTYRPVKPNEYEFSADASTPSDSTNFKFPLVIAITGTTNTSGAPGPAPFEGEVVSYVEYVGNIDAITHSHTDINGMSHIRNALPVKSAHDNPLAHAHKVISSVKSSLMAAAPVIGGGALAAHAMFGGSGSAASTVMSESRALVPYTGEAAAGESFFASLPGLAETAGASVLAGVEELAPLLAFLL